MTIKREGYDISSVEKTCIRDGVIRAFNNEYVEGGKNISSRIRNEAWAR
jgi:hypothetical protein